MAACSASSNTSNFDLLLEAGTDMLSFIRLQFLHVSILSFDVLSHSDEGPEISFTVTFATRKCTMILTRSFPVFAAPLQKQKWATLIMTTLSSPTSYHHIVSLYNAQTFFIESYTDLYPPCVILDFWDKRSTHVSVLCLCNVTYIALVFFLLIILVFIYPYTIMGH